MLIWSLGIPYFQLPLSGSPSRRRRASEPRSGLSTPSLGITILHCPRGKREPFGSLSTPSLGITYGYGRGRNASITGNSFNSLSRDHVIYFPEWIKEHLIRSFNSLSRDHISGFQVRKPTRDRFFQLPLSGSRSADEVAVPELRA